MADLNQGASRKDFEAWAKGQDLDLGGEYHDRDPASWYYWSDETAAAWEKWLEFASGKGANQGASIEARIAHVLLKNTSVSRSRAAMMADVIVTLFAADRTPLTAAEGEEGLPALEVSIDTPEFYEMACSWRDGGPDAALWSDLIDRIQEYARKEIALYQRKQAGQVGVKSWQERIAEDQSPHRWSVHLKERHMQAEIADLRAQLAAKGQGSAKFDLTDYSTAVNYSNGTSTTVIAPASAQPAEVADAHALLSKFCVADREGGQPMTLSARIEELYSWYQDAAQPDQRESAAVPDAALRSRAVAVVHRLYNETPNYKDAVEAGDVIQYFLTYAAKAKAAAAAPSPAAQLVAKEGEQPTKNKGESA
jgi:hypothetical protein